MKQPRWGMRNEGGGLIQLQPLQVLCQHKLHKSTNQGVWSAHSGPQPFWEEPAWLPGPNSSPGQLGSCPNTFWGRS